jgi:hypothetical protein
VLPGGMGLVLARPEVWRCSEGYSGKVASEDGEGERVLVEPYVEGFRKFNSNTGFRGAGTYAASKRPSSSRTRSCSRTDAL